MAFKSYVLIVANFIVAILLTISSFLAEAGPSDSSEVGFFSIHSPSVPEPIKTAARSVLKIQVPAIIFDLSISSQREKMEKFSSNLDTIILNQGERKVVRPQIEICRKSKDFCVIWISGSAIVLADGSILTAFHNVRYALKQSLDEGAKWNDAYKIKFPIRLIDSTGRILTGEGSLGKTKAKIKRLDKFAGKQNVHAELSDSVDFVILELDQRLKLPGVKINLQQKIYQGFGYLIGFPVTTSGRMAFDRLDSDGKSQYISFGTLLNENVNEVALKGDCASGMSGGALVDQAGSLLGVFTRNNTPQINSQPSTENRCIGVGVDYIFFNPFNSI